VLDILGDKWTLLIVRDMIYLGKSRFSHFQESPEKIPTNLLADRLKRLLDAGLIEAKPYQTRPVRLAYRPTARGRSLGRLLRVILDWGLKNLPDTRVPPAATIQNLRRKYIQASQDSIPRKSRRS
jgi:DNA-binding HxlR family transcriptional regulator